MAVRRGTKGGVGGARGRAEKQAGRAALAAARPCSNQRVRIDLLLLPCARALRGTERNPRAHGLLLDRRGGPPELFGNLARRGAGLRELFQSTQLTGAPGCTVVRWTLRHYSFSTTPKEGGPGSYTPGRPRARPTWRIDMLEITRFTSSGTQRGAETPTDGGRGRDRTRQRTAAGRRGQAERGERACQDRDLRRGGVRSGVISPLGLRAVTIRRRSRSFAPAPSGQWIPNLKKCRPAGGRTVIYTRRGNRKVATETQLNCAAPRAATGTGPARTPPRAAPPARRCRTARWPAASGRH